MPLLCILLVGRIDISHLRFSVSFSRPSSLKPKSFSLLKTAVDCNVVLRNLAEYNISVQTTASIFREFVSRAGKWEFYVRISRGLE